MDSMQSASKRRGDGGGWGGAGKHDIVGAGGRGLGGLGEMVVFWSIGVGGKGAWAVRFMGDSSKGWARTEMEWRMRSNDWCRRKRRKSMIIGLG